jgi:predicted anti-sigma-YlaC factor YlaD
MRCKYYRDVVDYFYGEIDEKRLELLQQHLQHCNECKKWLEHAEFIVRHYEKKNEDFRIQFEPFHRTLYQGVFRKFIKAFAMVLIISMIFLYGYSKRVSHLLTYFRLYHNYEIIKDLDRIIPVVAMEIQKQYEENNE